MDLEQKIEMFSLRLAEDPHSRLFAPLADLLRQAGRLEDALELLDDGLERHPDYVSALVIKGQTLLESGMMDQARSVLAQVLELDCENFVVLRLLTEDARSREAWAEAVPLLEKLVVLDPDDVRWNGALAEARKLLTPVASDAPAGTPEPTGSSFATMTLFDSYLALGYGDRALEALRDLESREPGREDVRQRLR
jgi:tetratricopeptide (TPR) repeat protein